MENMIIGAYYLMIVVGIFAAIVNIYAIVLIYKFHRLLYGKGTLWQIIGIIRLCDLIEVVFGKRGVYIAFILYGGFWGFSQILSGISNVLDNTSLDQLWISLAAIIFNIVFYIFTIILTFVYQAKYLRAKADRKYRKEILDDVEENKWDYHMISKGSNNVPKGDKQDDNGYYDDGL